MRKLFAFLAVLTHLVGCSGAGINDDDPGELLKEANKDFESDRYQLALEKLQTCKNKFPYSKVALECALRVGDVYFAQENFLEAAATYETFIELHPKHERVPYALFRKGESYFSDMPTNIARDLNSGNKALQAFEDFIRKYPADPKAGEVNDRIRATRAKLSDKQLYIGDFYSKRDFFESAEQRYTGLVQEFPETPAGQKALGRLENVTKELKDKKPEYHPISGAPNYRRYLK